MNSVPPFATKAASLLREDLGSHQPSPPSEHLIRAVAEAIRGRKVKTLRKQRILYAASAIAAVAACTVGALVWRSHATGATTAEPRATAAFVSGSVFVQNSGKNAALHDGSRFDEGAHIVTLADGKASLTWPVGTRVSLDGATDLSLLGQQSTKLFELDSGSIRADVAKLHEGERFVIRTSDAEVEVHGTSFRVNKVPADPACGEGTTTRVVVFEGIVTVRARGIETRVPAGDSWPHACAPLPVPSSGSYVAPAVSTELHGAVESTPALGLTESHASYTGIPGHTLLTPSQLDPSQSSPAGIRPAGIRPSAGAAQGAKTTSERSSFSPAPSASVDAPRKSDLSLQNDLFRQATEARARGDVAVAIKRFDELLARYPGGPLAETAFVERMRTLSAMGSAEAQPAAREYLRRYPNGFAHTEADRALSGGR